MDLSLADETYKCFQPGQHILDEYRNPSKENNIIIIECDNFIKLPKSLLQVLPLLSQMQIKIIMKMIEKVQDSISDICDDRYDNVNSIFSDSNLVNETFIINIPLKHIGVNKTIYQKLEDAAHKLEFLGISNNNSADNESIRFLRCDIPKSDSALDKEPVKLKSGLRRCGYLKISIDKKIAHKYFNASDGFIDVYINLYSICRSRYTFPIYAYLKQFKPKNENKWEHVLEYSQFRNIFKIEDSKYEDWRDFRKSILKRPQKELSELFRGNRCDFYFSIVKNGTKIRFSCESR